MIHVVVFALILSLITMTITSKDNSKGKHNELISNFSLVTSWFLLLLALNLT